MTSSNRMEQLSTPSIRALPILFLKSCAVMIPWPLLGIVLCHRMFDQPNEAAFLFGGITGIALVWTVFVGLPETAFVVILVVAWCLALVVPPVVMYRRRPSQTAIVVIQGGFSIAQAALGALMVLGKGC